jgi:hypothetical protein
VKDRPAYVTSSLHKQDVDFFWKASEIRQVDNPTLWHIMKQGDESEHFQLEEVVFTLTGVIASKDLPPLHDKPRYASNVF